MILFPAIDLKEGRCVRLRRGEMGTAAVFNDVPAAQAKLFADAGFEWIHCVDLDGAFAGHAANAEAVAAIRAAVGVNIQLGGGIRNRAAIEGWLEAGIARVILGTAALRAPELVREAARTFPGRIAVGIDSRDGRAATEGWSKTSDTDVVELAHRFEDTGVSAIIFTDISRDGMEQGVSIDATVALAHAVRIPVIASGGIAGIGDLEALAKIANLEGAVVGRALYDGSLDAAAALAFARDAK